MRLGLERRAQALARHREAARRSDRDDVAVRLPPSSTAISPNRSPSPSVRTRVPPARRGPSPRATRRARSRLARPHDRLAVRVAALLAGLEDPREELPRQRREDAPSLSSRSYRPPWKSSGRLRRSARTRPGRGRASGRRPSRSGRPSRRGARARPRRAASRGRARSAARASATRPPAKRSESGSCPAASTLIPKRAPSRSSAFRRARRSTEMSTSGGSSDTDMNAFAVIPCTCSPARGRDDGDAGGEHPERPPELERGVGLEPRADLERLARRNCLERRPERLGRGDRGPRSTSNSSGAAEPSIRGMVTPEAARAAPLARLGASGRARRCVEQLARALARACPGVLAPVRPLAVLDDPAEEEERDPDREHREADHLLLRAAVAAGRDLEPAEADDREDDADDGEHAGDRDPVVAEADRTRPGRPVAPQQDERRDREEVREHVAEVRRGEDAEDVADEETKPMLTTMSSVIARPGTP